MSNELNVMVRADEYNIYRIYCVNDDSNCHRILEMETNTRHVKGEEVIIGYDDIEYRCEVRRTQHNLYRQRLSETVVRWKFSHLYILRESVCQEKRLEESTVEG